MAIPYSDILQAVIEATPDAIFVKDLNGRYVLVNEAAAKFLGRSPADIIGKHDLELYPEETARQFIADDKRVLASGQAQSFEGVATSPLGTQAYLVTKGVYRDTHGRILGIYGISHDITELRVANETLAQTREALFRAQKMEAVGQLTGGIAHDFNNILVVILGNLELLRLHLPDDTYARELIDAMMRATMHGQDLTADLLAFSRRRQLNPEPVAINALIENTVRLLGRTLGVRIHVTTSTSDEVLVAMVDAAALEAAVLNVALNARDAMPNGGTLAITTSKVEITAQPTTGDELSPGSYAMLSFTDTGAGMAPDVLARVFEPFFTTKTGHGTGLGLSMVYGFVKQSGGTVTLESKPGAGTTVRMYFPLSKNEPRPISPSALPRPHIAARTILLVEDETAVRNTVRRQLETLGHRVLSADNARDALLMLNGPGAADVLLTDVILGAGMNGVDLAERAREQRPTLPVIFMSGYTAPTEAQERIAKAGAPLLMKPSTLAQLEAVITKVIE